MVRDEHCAYVPRCELHAALRKAGIAEQFSEMFGIQTCTMHGPYPWDCEAVLERIASGNLTGTQLCWD